MQISQKPNEQRLHYFQILNCLQTNFRLFQSPKLIKVRHMFLFNSIAKIIHCTIIQNVVSNVLILFFVDLLSVDKFVC